MSQITIQCRLVADEVTRQFLWTLMAGRNTPLINELIEQLSQHEEFEAWRRKGKVSSSVVTQLCKSLKTDSRFSGQPARLYVSAEHTADYIFKSWLAIQKQLQQRLDGKLRWLEMLKSDEELAQESEVDIAEIRDRASAILAQFQPSTSSDKSIQKQSKKGKKSRKADSSDPSLASQLFDRYRDSKCLLEQCAIAYLLKNGSKIPDQDENPQKFTQRRRKVEIQAKRLQDQIESRIPHGRDLTGQSWLNTLEIATQTVPQDNTEAKRWQDRLLTDPTSLPFPLVFETNEDLVWQKNVQGRLCVRFNGLSDYTFKVYCDQRQLHWFKRFLTDQKTKKAGKNQHSSGLFTLRSARLAWQQGEGKGNPWDLHRLTLYCTVDTRLWSAEGTEQVRQEKAAEVAQKITQMENKGDLLKTQQAYVKRLSSTLARINTPFDRPSKPLYCGQPQVIVGLSIGLEKPATIAVWDAATNQVLANYGIRQLLGKDYRLLTRRRSEQQKTAHQRHKAQKQSAPNQFGESELGQHVDRLLAKSIVAIAKSYKSGSIAIPKLGTIREIVEAEIKAKAEQKCPGYVEGQQKYAKQYRASVHRWSYGRLIDSIRSQAIKLGIAIEEAKQPLAGKLEEKARDVAIAAYQARSN
ncbi:hypothetical protein H6F88_08380 [Oculatella sp. FACHB-28]|uniref:type V CRISPR-associated protein Cas12k n=1 Tax=Oculatella sp. FACHB-28 TaxID=2692845 RepID=UPI0016857A9F|nr:type V CRISPR-associated protein Cas12k [Oculatella sp. FACHB-28]MBD2056034.1 hypothetical protein [Oculatella sp. FACHB-28]